MTNLLSLFDPRIAVGFDDMVKRLAAEANSSLRSVAYPPYNIKKVDENKYVVEMAVAGFGKSDIDITIEDGNLKITGKVATDDTTGAQYLYKGIAERNFARAFTIADTIEVKNAELFNGMLRVWLENIIPDSKKPRKVEVKDSTTKEKTLLRE